MQEFTSKDLTADIIAMSTDVIEDELLSRYLIFSEDHVGLAKPGSDNPSHKVVSFLRLVMATKFWPMSEFVCKLSCLGDMVGRSIDAYASLSSLRAALSYLVDLEEEDLASKGLAFDYENLPKELDLDGLHIPEWAECPYSSVDEAFSDASMFEAVAPVEDEEIFWVADEPEPALEERYPELQSC